MFFSSRLEFFGQSHRTGNTQNGFRPTDNAIDCIPSRSNEHLTGNAVIADMRPQPGPNQPGTVKLGVRYAVATVDK